MQPDTGFKFLLTIYTCACTPSPTGGFSLAEVRMQTGCSHNGMLYLFILYVKQQDIEVNSRNQQMMTFIEIGNRLFERMMKQICIVQFND